MCKCSDCGKEIGHTEAAVYGGRCYRCNKQYEDAQRCYYFLHDIQTETYGEDNIICPYCGYEMQDDDGFFINQGEGTYECPECGKEFEFEAEARVEYSTHRIKPCALEGESNE